MNRREAITGAGGFVLSAGAGLPLISRSETIPEQTTQQSHIGHFFGGHENQITHTTVATVDDPDVEQILISVLIKKDHARPLDSFVIERALLKHVGTNLISWFQHCRDNGMKTF